MMNDEYFETQDLKFLHPTPYIMIINNNIRLSSEIHKYLTLDASRTSAMHALTTRIILSTRGENLAAGKTFL